MIYYISSSELMLLQKIKSGNVDVKTTPGSVKVVLNHLSMRDLVRRESPIYPHPAMYSLTPIGEDVLKGNHVIRDSFESDKHVVIDFLSKVGKCKSSDIAKYADVNTGHLTTMFKSGILSRDEREKPYTYWINNKRSDYSQCETYIDNSEYPVFPTSEFIVLEKLNTCILSLDQIYELLVDLKSPDEVIKRLLDSKAIVKISPFKYKISLHGKAELDKLNSELDMDSYLKFIVSTLYFSEDGMSAEQIVKHAHREGACKAVDTSDCMDIEKRIFSKIQKAIRMKRVCEIKDSNPSNPIKYKLTPRGKKIAEREHIVQPDNKSVDKVRVSDTDESKEDATVNEVDECMKVLKSYGYSDGRIRGIVVRALKLEIDSENKRLEKEERKKKIDALDAIQKQIEQLQHQMSQIKADIGA